MDQIRARMLKLGITQVDMILELQKRGIVVQPPEMSCVLRGIYTGPKSRRILKECDKILKYREAE